MFVRRGRGRRRFGGVGWRGSGWVAWSGDRTSPEGAPACQLSSDRGGVRLCGARDVRVLDYHPLVFRWSAPFGIFFRWRLEIVDRL